MSVVVTEQLSIGYPGRHGQSRVVMRDLNLVLKAGELVCLLGPNGTGKSTLMRTLAGIQKPLSGTVTYCGEDVHRLSAKALAKAISIVLTERVNVGLMSGYALVALGRYPHTDRAGQITPHDRDVIRWAVESVGGSLIAPRLISELSDGERQRLMIARALAQEAGVILLDEPTAYLDLPRRVEMMRLLKRLARSTQHAVLVSTHDLDLALRTADSLWLMRPDGAGIFNGAPEDMALDGRLNDVFQTDGVTFDEAVGSFRIIEAFRGEIRIVGDGLRATWTRRAIERAGFKIVSDNQPATFSIDVDQDDAPYWKLTHDGTPASFDSIYALIVAVNALYD